MSVNYIVWDMGSDVPARWGQCQPGFVDAQAGEGERAIEMRDASLAWAAGNLSPIRDALLDRIDREAGAIRARFITDVPGQAQTYEKKEAEARAWTAGDPEADYPFMAAEATVRGVPIAQVRAEIMAQVDALKPIAALVEAHRIHAKQSVKDAETVAGMILAATVDWEAVLA